MDFIVILTIMIVISAGILTLVPAPAAFRLAELRSSGPALIRKALLETANKAAKRLIFFRSAKRLEIVRRELYSSLSILRNYGAAVDGEKGPAGASITTDYLLEHFAQTEGELKRAYSGALRLFRTGRRAEAAEYFAAAAVDPLAHDFIILVLDWDAVAPHKLKQAVLAFQNALKEARTTELMRKNEVLSDLVYLPVIIGVLIVFVNFIYVAYFAEQRALLAELFF